MSDAFFTAYNALLARWPADLQSTDLDSPYGRTRVYACGPRHAPPLLLIPGGGATAMVWSTVVPTLARVHRVYAIDLLADAGHSLPSRFPLDPAAWLESVLDGLQEESVFICGHSYGGWLGLTYALHAPGRVAGLALLDPTSCFAGLSLRYLLRAAPMLAWPSPQRVWAFLRWETAGLPIDEQWLKLAGLAAELPRPRLPRPRRPIAQDLRQLTLPTLVLLAEHSRCHDINEVVRSTRHLIPPATVDTIPNVSHHSLPTGAPTDLSQRLLNFLQANSHP